MLVRRKMYYGQVHVGYNKIVVMKGGFQGVVAQPGRPLCAHYNACRFLVNRYINGIIVLLHEKT